MIETTFNLYLPSCSIFGNTASPTSLVISAYDNPLLLSYYSGYSVSDLSTFTVEDWGTSASYSGKEYIFSLFMDNNSVFNGSTGIYQETTIYNFYTGRPLSTYFSGKLSTLGGMLPYTLNELSVIKYT